jgi:hypothetical protein
LRSRSRRGTVPEQQQENNTVQNTKAFWYVERDGQYYSKPEQKAGLGRGSWVAALTPNCLYATELGATKATAGNALGGTVRPAALNW